MVKTSTCMEGHVFTHIIGWVLEHLKYLLKMISWYWSLASNHSQMTEVWMGLHCSLHTRYVGTDEVMSSFLFTLTFMVLGDGWPYMDEAHQSGEQPSGLLPRCSSFLDSECTQQSSGRLLRHFQINYPRSSSIRVCIAVWNQLHRDGGGVTSTHVRTALG